MTKNKNLQLIQEYLFIAIVCLSPLPFGSTSPVAYSFLSFFTGLMLLLWVFRVYKDPESYSFGPQKIWLVIIAFSAGLAFSLFQSMFLPPFASLYNETAAILGTAPPEDFNRKAAFEAIMRFVAYAGIFWLALQLGRSPRFARSMLLSVCISACAYSIYGIGKYLIGGQAGPLQLIHQRNGQLVGTFINHNHYATYTGMAIITTCGLLIKNLLKDSENLRGKRRIKQIISNTTKSGMFFLTILIFLSISLILSNSRAGIFSSFIGLVIFIVSLTFAKKDRSLKKILHTLSIFIIFLLFWVFSFTGYETINRTSYIDYEFGNRTKIYSATLKAIEDNALLGSGLGTFEEIFDIYRPESMFYLGGVRVDKAHNSYLQLMLELGIPAATAIFLALGAIFFFCFRGIKNRTAGYLYPAIGLGIFGIAACHSMFDFSLEIPAIMINFAALIGISLAQSWSLSNNLGIENDD